MELAGSFPYTISLFHNDNKQYNECYVTKDASCFELSKSKFGCFFSAQEIAEEWSEGYMGSCHVLSSSDNGITSVSICPLGLW